MNHAEKLKLLVQCDFSWHRERKRNSPSYGGEMEFLGFGNAFHGVYSGVGNIADGISPENAIVVASNAFGYMKTCYGRIPWNDISEGDEDFRFLFEYREGMSVLEADLAALKAVLENGGRISRQSPEFVSLVGRLDALKSRDYRAEVLRKHGVEFADPPNQ